MQETTCWQCRITFAVPNGMWGRRFDKPIICPNGHENHWQKGPSEEKQEIERLKRRLEIEEDVKSFDAETHKEIFDHFRKCSVLGCEYASTRYVRNYGSLWALSQLAERITRDLQDHMAQVHGVIEVPEAEEATTQSEER